MSTTEPYDLPSLAAALKTAENSVAEFFGTLTPAEAARREDYLARLAQGAGARGRFVPQREDLTEAEAAKALVRKRVNIEARRGAPSRRWR